MQANSWPEDLRLKYVSTFLDGEANDWFNENSSRIISWSSFRGQIIKQFTSTYSDIQAFQRLKDYHQTIHQTITQYYNEMIKLLKEVDPSMEETLKVNYLMSNMNNSLKYEMYKKQPKTTVQFLDIAKRFEDLQKLKENDQRRNSYLTETESITTVTSSAIQPTTSRNAGIHTTAQFTTTPNHQSSSNHRWPNSNQSTTQNQQDNRNRQSYSHQPQYNQNHYEHHRGPRYQNQQRGGQDFQ
ncbi:unnamed protein product [Didymodactylos carnosus]|nr:unnamed protein product [Didymodactylos carnosus]CAF4144863.1 unnamed protein product [Didymodactylos carnosus]